MRRYVCGSRSILALCAGALLMGCLPSEAQRTVRLTRTQQRQLNTFFSNFAEAGVEPFKQGKIAGKALIEFGVTHNIVNRGERFESGRDWRLPQRVVEESVYKYFGKRISRHQSPNEYTRYSGGYYILGRAAGEGITFAQVTRFQHLGKNRYAAVLNVYGAANGWVGDVHVSPKNWREPDEEKPRLRARMMATIQQVTERGKTRYILLDYQKR
jgi:hypothetical protein